MKKILFILLFILAGCGEETTIINNQETIIMINLSSIFQEANNQSEKERDVLVLIEDVTLFEEKTTEADWGNNVSESNVDYTSSPPDADDVILVQDIIPDEENATGNTWFELFEAVGDIPGPSSITGNHGWQSFKQDTGAPKTINIVEAYFKASISEFNIICTVWSSGKSSQLSTQLSQPVTSTTGQTLSFDFSSQSIEIENNTEYWIRFTPDYTGAFPFAIGIKTLHQYYQNTDIYADGQFDITGDSPASNIGDAVFSISFEGDFYKTSGNITTDNIDIGEVPTSPGEWVIEDTTPDDSTLTYEAWHSATGAFTGEEVSIGAIIDGQAITDLKRYWRVKASFTSSTDRSETPTLQSIKADYTTFRRFNRIHDLGYEPLVNSLSSLTSKVDFFKPASIGTISTGIVMTDAISDWVFDDTLFNKIVKVKIGFKYPGFTEADYIFYFTGAIDNWDVNDGVLNLSLKDLSKDWKLPVPRKWEPGDDESWTDEHPIDVMLDIFQNHISVRDAGILLDFFTTVKSATPAYRVSRTITGKTEDAKKLVEELRVLLWAFFLPRGDGKIGIKQFDKNEAIKTTFTDDNTVNIKWKANSDDLINRTSLYFGWNGTGENESDFLEYDPGDNGTSQSDHRVIKPFSLKDKWTQASEASQISGLETKILDQFDEMPTRVTITCDAKDIAYEAGDMVGVTTLNAPGNNGDGITDEKYLLVSKNLDFLGDKIIFEGLKVAV